jgi:chemotaxis protein methyltransferase CheR
MALRPDHFTFVSTMVRADAAIVLEPGKEYLVESRLLPVARREGHPSLDAFIDAAMKSSPGSPIRYLIVDALTTNETLFFRDFHPFEALRTEILPKVIEARQRERRIAIWSAAASTGQEAYSIAMMIREHFPQVAGWDVKIIGTDLSTTTLDVARSGSYSQLEVNRGLPAPYLVKYFQKLDGRWVLKEDVRRMAEFRQMNLIQAWPALPPFDLVFIRNVLIYFDTPTKQTILRKIKNTLLPHGSLFLGTAETTMNIDPEWMPTPAGRTTVFRLKSSLKAPLPKAA